MITNLELKNAYPGHARDIERRVPERRHGEVDREQRLLAGHDGRSDRRAAARQGDAAAVARTGDGSADHGRASATTATRACTRTICRGRRRPRRCRPRRIRAWCSSGCSATAAARRTALAELRKNASLLDWVNDDIARLQRKLGPGDRTKVNQYLDTVREVERRIQKAEAADRGFATARSRPSGGRAGRVCGPRAS